MLSDIISPVFFAPCVASHQAALERGDFEKGFYYGLLLQPSLVFLDTSFFLITALQENVKQSSYGDSWLEVALKRGAIIPFVRKDVSQFSDITDILMDDQFSGVSREQKDFVDLISRSVSKMQVWPDKSKYNFGLELAERVESIFLLDVPPIPNQLPMGISSQLEVFWAETRHWRTTWIPKALGFRKKLGGEGHGLRLTDIIAVATEDILGMPNGDVRTASDLLKVAEKVMTRKKVLVLRALLIFLDELYLRNLCQGMNTCGITLGLTRPRWHPLISLFGQEQTGTEKQPTRSANSGEFLEDTRVTLPSLNTLRRTSGKTLEKIWDSGEEYFAAFEQWRAEPSEERTKHVCAQLDSYCRTIVSMTRSDDTSLENYRLGMVRANDLITYLSSLAGLLAFSAVQSSKPVELGATASTVSFAATCFVLRPVFQYFAKRRKQVNIPVRFKSGISFGRAPARITQFGKVFRPTLDVIFPDANKP